MDTKRIGIVGVGRLGTALGSRLRESHEVVVCDVDARKAKQVAKQGGFTHLYLDELLDRVELLLVCIPPQEVARFFRTLPGGRARHPLYVNTATSVDTLALVEALGLDHLRIVGLKPVGQHSAVQQRTPFVFVTASANAEELAVLRRVFGPLGQVVVGDERKVGPLNRLATRVALQAGLRFVEEARSLAVDDEWTQSAVRSVMAGTLMDYPPEPDNAYTASVLRELVPERAPPRDLRVAGFHDFGGVHCETTALRKLLRHHGLTCSEELLFGLGGGIGFVFWQQPGAPVPFVGGRNGSFPHFLRRAARALGLQLDVWQSDSADAARDRLIEELGQGRPAVCYGDIFHLPYFHARRHFGAHAFVVYGLSEREDRAWISDRGVHPRIVTLGELARARGSGDHPFPPRHAMLQLQVRGSAEPRPEALREAIVASCEALRHPPTAYLGLPGLTSFGEWLRNAARELPPPLLLEAMLTTYVNLELAGTGGCAFRRMYHRFLEEARQWLPHPALDEGMARLEQVLPVWRRMIEALLPEVGPETGRLRRALFAREQAFEQADDEQAELGAAHTRELAEAFAPASAELACHRDALDEACVLLEKVSRVEGSFADELLRGLKGATA